MAKKATAFLICFALVLGLLPGISVKNVLSAETGVYNLDMSLFAVGDKITGGVGDLGRSGGADITVVEENGGKSIKISNRKDNWDALDIQTENLLLKRNNTYQITITGHVDSGVETNGANIKLGSVTKKDGEGDGYPEFAKVPAEAGKSFTLKYDLTISSVIGDADRQLAVLRVQTDEGSAANPGDIITFYVDNITIIQTAEGASENQAVQTKAAELDIYRLDKSLFTLNEKFVGGIGDLGRSGGADIVLIEEGDNETIQISNRKDNWDALDVQVSNLNLKRDNTYEITVTGHVDAGVETNLANIKLGGVTTKDGEGDGYPELLKVPAEAGESFTLKYSFSVGTLIPDSSRQLSVLRIQTDEGSAANPGDLINFCVDDITIIQTAEAVPVAAPAESGSGESVVLYELDFDKVLTVSGELSPELKKSGDADVSIVEDADGTVAIEVNNRVNNYDGVDLLLDALKQDGLFLSGKYTVEVTGQVLSGQDPSKAQFIIGMTESPWGELTSRTVPEEDGTFVLTLTREYTAADLSMLGYSFRIQSPPGITANFLVNNIKVTVEGVSAADTAVTELQSYTFDDKDAQFTVSGSSQIEWVNDNGLGKDSDTALKVTHISGKSYASADNAVRLKLTEALPAGGVYKVSAWIFVPAEENADKDVLTGVGIVLNGDYAGATGESKFPNDPGTMPVGEWKEFSVTMPMSKQNIESIDFRFVVNDEAKHPDVWYIDSITISSIGELVKIEVPEWDESLESLYKAYSKYFIFGNIMEPNQIDDEQTAEMFKQHYNMVTAENSMKPVNISRSKDTYSFDGSDNLITWAESNDISVHGHTLVWHSQSSPWVNKDDNGEPLTRAEAKANLEKYINTVAGHFKGRLASWDVVNEAFADGKSYGDWKDVLRTTDSAWYMAYSNGADESKGEDGSDYIYDAFVLTRLADPNATLYYNDYNEQLSDKREAIASMTEELNAKWKQDPRNTQPERLLIEGIGMQSHHFTGDLDVSAVEEAIKRFIKTGAEISVTELDIPFDTYATYRQRTTAPTEDEYKIQAELYQQLFQVYKKYAGDIVRVTIWGKADSQSWRSEGYPVLFNKMFKPKDSYYSIINEAAVAPAVAASYYNDTANHWANESIEKVTKEGIFSGIGGGSFGPDKTLTRSMGVAVLWRMAGSPELDSNKEFTNVPANEWYASPAIWATAFEIIEGADANFEPNDALTMEDFVVMIYNYANLQGLDTEAYSDVWDKYSADGLTGLSKDAFAYALSKGIIDNVNTDKSITRAEAAVIIAKVLDLK